MVQRADGRSAEHGQRDRRRLLPGAAASGFSAGAAAGRRAGGRRFGLGKSAGRTRSRHALSAAGTCASRRGVSRDTRSHLASCGHARRGRGLAVDFDRLYQSVRRPARRAYCGRDRGVVGHRARRGRRRAGSCRRSNSIVSEGCGARRRCGQRLVERSVRRARPADDERVRGLSADAGPQAAAGRRVLVVLPDAHADDSRERYVDGFVPRQAHYATGADALHGCQRDRCRAPRPPRRPRDDRRVRIAHRCLQQHGGRAGRQPPPVGALGGRSGAQASRCREPAAVRGDDSRSDCDRCAVGRRCRPHWHCQQRRGPDARYRCQHLGSADDDRAQPCRAEAACHPARRGLAQPRRDPSAGAGARPRRP